MPPPNDLSGMFSIHCASLSLCQSQVITEPGEFIITLILQVNSTKICDVSCFGLLGCNAVSTTYRSDDLPVTVTGWYRTKRLTHCGHFMLYYASTSDF